MALHGAAASLIGLHVFGIGQQVALNSVGEGFGIALLEPHVTDRFANYHRHGLAIQIVFLGQGFTSPGDEEIDPELVEIVEFGLVDTALLHGSEQIVHDKLLLFFDPWRVDPRTDVGTNLIFCICLCFGCRLLFFLFLFLFFLIFLLFFLRIRVLLAVFCLFLGLIAEATGQVVFLLFNKLWFGSTGLGGGRRLDRSWLAG